MRTKKYWRELSEQHYRDLQETRNLLDLSRQAIKFLLSGQDAYRVELTAGSTPINVAPYSRPITHFEYVDQNGKYHYHTRSVGIETIEVISTNAETAIFKYETLKGKYTYWILNKANETVAEIPEDYFCHRGTKICEVKEAGNGNNQSNG